MSCNRLAGVQADFLRGVTHDLQTPLTSIAALATELRAAPDQSAETRDDLDSIAHQAERLRRMVSQLLVASRLDAGVFTPQQEVFAVAPLVERTWAALRADRPFELDVTGAAAPGRRRPGPIGAGPLGRARQRGQVQPVTVAGASPGSTRRTGCWPSRFVTAARDGRRDAARAFEQFYRSDAARKLAPDGSGVGLYAASGLMRAMGGDFALASRLGHGTTMTLSLPAERAEPGPISIGPGSRMVAWPQRVRPMKFVRVEQLESVGGHGGRPYPAGTPGRA